MATKSSEIPRLTSLPIEQALRKDETRIRSLALPLARAEPLIQLHLNAVLMAEDLYDVHESAADRQRSQGAIHFAESHERFRDQAMQLKLHHLGQLSNLVI